MYIFYDRPHSPDTVGVHPGQATARTFSRPDYLDWLSLQLDPLEMAILDPR